MGSATTRLKEIDTRLKARVVEIKNSIVDGTWDSSNPKTVLRNVGDSAIWDALFVLADEIDRSADADK